MLIEERYRAALVALRDGQWEAAATHLLTIATENPTYRDIDRVLEVLERTRSVSYWCAAFEIAHAQGSVDGARAALTRIAAVAPDLPRLTTLRAALSALAPDPAERILTDDWDSDENDVFATWLDVPLDELPIPEDTTISAQHPTDETVEPPESATDPFNSLEIDPLTALLLNDEWLTPPAPELEIEPSSAEQVDLIDVDVEFPDPLEPPSDAPTQHDDWFDSWASSSDSEEQDSGNLWDARPASAFDTDPLPLPEEPEGDFIRLALPPALDEGEPVMATNSHEHPELSDPPFVSIPAPGPGPEPEPEPIKQRLAFQHRYSGLQFVGLLSFPLILLGVAMYVLFAQGGNTLFDMLREAQTGNSINTTLDLIAAIDTQLTLSGDTPAIQARLEDYTGLAGLLADETPDLEDALTTWISAGNALVDARAAAEQACRDPESQACHAAQQAIGNLAEQVEQSRASVCALTSCPTTRAAASS